MIMPSSVGVISAPIARRPSVTVAIRSDSLTLSSAASRMMVSPFAAAAITARTGSSSIRVGIRLPSMTVPFREEVRTSRSAAGSPCTVSFTGRMSAPMAFAAWRIPARVGLVPVFRISSSDPGTRLAAAMK